MDKGVFDRFRSLPIARIAPLSGALLADTRALRHRDDAHVRHGLPHGLPARRRSRRRRRARACSSSSARGRSAGSSPSSASIARTASSVQGISMLILFPLTFMSNAFVPADTMPGWLQWFVNVNPVSHLVTAVRELVNDGTVATDVSAAARRRRDRGGLRTAHGPGLHAQGLSGCRDPRPRRGAGRHGRPGSSVRRQPGSDCTRRFARFSAFRLCRGLPRSTTGHPRSALGPLSQPGTSETHRLTR